MSVTRRRHDYTGDQVERMLDVLSRVRSRFIDGDNPPPVEDYFKGPGFYRSEQRARPLDKVILIEWGKLYEPFKDHLMDSYAYYANNNSVQANFARDFGKALKTLADLYELEYDG